MSRMKATSVDRMTDVVGAIVMCGAAVLGLVIGVLVGYRTAPDIKSYSGGVDYATTRANDIITGQPRPAVELSTDCGQYVDSGLAASHGYDRPDLFRQGCLHVVKALSKK